MTCDGRDVIANHLMIPDNMEVGDWMSMGGMGSYTFGPRSKFNGMKSTTKIC
jgi:diaminopimelate decarboxylase